MLYRKCKICDNSFYINSKNDDKIVCSPTCAAKYGYLKNSEIRQCYICKSDFRILKTSNRQTCEKHRRSYILVCNECGNDYIGRKNSMYCSYQCASVGKAKKTKKYNCDYCGKEYDILIIAASKNKNHYCSEDCKKRYYRDNKPKGPRKYSGIWNRIRKQALKRDNNKCLLCGSTNNLEVHHFKKVLDFDTPEDSHYIENLGTFCRTCHHVVEDENYLSYADFMKDIVCSH